MQYNQTVMQCLSEIKDKKILLVVAHPDDETLWFFQSLQKLKFANEILVFCLTHAASSERGKELSKVAEHLGLKIVFGHCEDTGIDHFLKPNELKQAFIQMFSKNKIDLAVTHPPHGGEKPHPHHIQLYFMTKEFCDAYHVQFGFFSEQKLLDRTTNERLFRFTIKKKRYVCNRLSQGYHQICDDDDKFYFYIKSILSMLFNFQKYSGFEVAVDLEEKQSALANFESQQEILKNYNAFYKKFEYLYVERLHQNRDDLSLEHFWSHFF